MTNTKEIAEAIKNYLVELSINDKLPMDLTQLSIDKLEKVIKSKLPTEEEKRIERASHYLCESDDMTMEGQLDLIDAQAEIDDSVMLDDVDGIIVWEKVEYSFTVRDFLDEISN